MRAVGEWLRGAGFHTEQVGDKVRARVRLAAAELDDRELQ